MTYKVTLFPFSQQFWFCAIARHLHVVAVFPAPHASMPAGFRTLLSFLVHGSPLFFWLWLELSTIRPFFHQAAKARCGLQGCISLLSFLQHSFCSCFRHRSFIQDCSCFCQLIRLLVAFDDKIFKVRHILMFSFFVRCALTCSTSTTISLAAKRCNSS